MAIRYAFKVVNKANSRETWSKVVYGVFEGGYVGMMLADAKSTAKRMHGKLVESNLGHVVECANGDTDCQLAERWSS